MDLDGVQFKILNQTVPGPIPYGKAAWPVKRLGLGGGFGAPCGFGLPAQHAGNRTKIRERALNQIKTQRNRDPKPQRVREKSQRKKKGTKHSMQQKTFHFIPYLMGRNEPTITLLPSKKRKIRNYDISVYPCPHVVRVHLDFNPESPPGFLNRPFRRTLKVFAQTGDIPIDCTHGMPSIHHLSKNNSTLLLNRADIPGMVQNML